MWPSKTKQKVKKILRQFCRDEGIEFSDYKRIRDHIDFDCLHTLDGSDIFLLADALGTSDVTDNEPFDTAYFLYVSAFLQTGMDKLRPKAKVIPIESVKNAKILPFERPT